MQRNHGAIYDRKSRAYARFTEAERRAIRLAHPETGGSAHLAHNWGNAEAQAVMARFSARWDRRSAAYDRAYHKAEHAHHGADFRPIWCPLCAQEASHA